MLLGIVVKLITKPKKPAGSEGNAVTMAPPAMPTALLNQPVSLPGTLSTAIHRDPRTRKVGWGYFRIHLWSTWQSG